MFVWKQLSPSVPHDLPFGTACGMTDTGLVREANEDNFLIDPHIALAAIADGMGGHEAGEIASASALSLLLHFLREKSRSATAIPNFKPSPFDPVQCDPEARCSAAELASVTTLHHALEFTNPRLYQDNIDQRRPTGAGMGTTLTACWQPRAAGPVLVCHVGDTRLYRFRDARLTQLTRDHTVYQQALDSGMHHRLPSRNLLMQAIGPAGEVRPDLFLVDSEPGDLLLLCSDGLHGSSSNAQLGALLSSTIGLPLRERCARLIDLAKRDGSRDNITVLLIECQ